MAVKGLQALYNLILKDVVKGSGQASGIMSIGGDVRKLANKKFQSYITAAQKQGVDLDNYSEQELKYIVQLSKPKAPKVISADSPKGKGITEALFGKEGKVIKADFGKPFAEEIDDIADKKVIEQMYRTAGPRSLDEDAGYLAEFIADDAGKVLDDLPIKEQTKFIERAKNALRKNVKQYQPKKFPTAKDPDFYDGPFDNDAEKLAEIKMSNEGFIDDIITDIKQMEPMKSMKEANKVLKGEGRYKNLSQADREKIVNDESVTDHIFERNVPIDPEDMAQGGRAGHYTGGMVDVEPNLSDIGHGSDSLMARTRLISPNNQATTSTGLNYLLAEDNDNLRVPFADGNGVADEDAEKAALGKRVRQLMDDGFEFGEAVRKAMSEGYAEGGRIGFSKGKGVDLLRRGFLKAAGAAGAGIAALKTGLLGFGKQATKEVAKEVITTPAAAGKPEWFDALVTRVINEGDDVTKKFATKDREIVHATKIDDDAMVTVYRDLDEGTVRVDIDDATKNVMGEQGDSVVSLEVRGGQLEEGVKGKTPVEFEAVEADYRNYMDGPDDFTTETIDNVVSDTKDLTADLTKVKLFAKGQKKPTIKEMMIQRDRAKTLKQAEERPSEYAADRGPDIDTKDYDYASGGIARMIGE
jgi:hypothetical protein